MQRLFTEYGGESARFFLASQKRRRDFDDEIDKYYQKSRKSRRKCEAEGDFLLTSSISAAGYLRKVADVKCENVDRTQDKLWWSNGYEKWTNDQFKHYFRVSRDTFQLILRKIGPFIDKEPTNMGPEPIETHRQLALTIYRLGHGVTFNTLADLFGVSMALAERTFNRIIRLFVSTMYDTYVKMP